MKKAMLGNLLLLFAALIWGFALVAQVVSVDSGLGPVSFNAIRFGIGAIVLIPVIMIFDRKKKEGQRTKDLVIGSLLSGVMLFFAANLQQYALTVNANPGLAGFITALYTVWTPVAYFLVFKKKTTANVWIAVAVSIVGFYLLCMGDGGKLTFGTDIIILLISTLFWTAQILSVDHFVEKVSPLKLSLGQYAVCTVLSFIYSFVFELDTLTLTAVSEAKWSILYCGVLSVGVAYTLQVVGQKMTNPVVAVILMSTESVFSAVGGVLWNLIVPVTLAVEQNISIVGYIGCAVIFAGVVISQVNISAWFKGRGSSNT
jgi:drug/metabolite transporter (DMT)-like permease